MEALKILLLGICASGKTTIAKSLTKQGYDVGVCSQEHSQNPQLWRRQNADFVVVLDCQKSTAEKRRQKKMNLRAYQEQKQKLLDARDHCHLFLPTDNDTVEETAKKIITVYREFNNSFQNC